MEYKYASKIPPSGSCALGEPLQCEHCLSNLLSMPKKSRKQGARLCMEAK